MNQIDDQLRTIILQCLQNSLKRGPRDGPYQLGYLFRDVAEVARSRSLETQSGHNAWLDNGQGCAEIYPNLKGSIRDILWDLVVEGIVRPGGELCRGEDTLPWLHVTEYGKNTLKGTVTPHDPDGYLKRLSELVPSLDPIIAKYIAESAETLRRSCFLSSTSTLGSASEKAFLVLLDAYESALNPVDQAAFSKAREKDWRIKKQHAVFMDWYERKLKARLKKDKDSDWMTELDDTLMFVFSYFRRNRNDASHPTGTVLPKDVVLSHLVVFPSYLRVIYDLIDWLSANKPM